MFAAIFNDKVFKQDDFFTESSELHRANEGLLIESDIARAF